MGFFTKIMTKIMHGNVDRVAKAIEGSATGAKEWREIKKSIKKNITWTEFQKQVKEWKKQFKGSLIAHNINSYVAGERLKKSKKRARNARKKADEGLTF